MGYLTLQQKKTYLEIQYIHLQFYKMTLYLEEVLILDGQTAGYCNTQHHLAVISSAVIISIIKLLRFAAFTKNASKCECSKNLNSLSNSMRTITSVKEFKVDKKKMNFICNFRVPSTCTCMYVLYYINEFFFLKSIS